MQVRQDTKTDDDSATARPLPCRCGGTGAFTIDIKLADAVVSDRRLCLVHGLTPRRLLLDTSTQRVGELMEVTGTGPYRRAWLRPPNGGKEWDTHVGNLRPAEGHS